MNKLSLNILIGIVSFLMGIIFNLFSLMLDFTFPQKLLTVLFALVMGIIVYFGVKK